MFFSRVAQSLAETGIGLMSEIGSLYITAHNISPTVSALTALNTAFPDALKKSILKLNPPSVFRVFSISKWYNQKMIGMGVLV